MVYLQGDQPLEQNNNQYNNVIIKTDDYISVAVFGDDKESSKPFNYPVDLITSTTMAGFLQGAPASQGYLVDKEGFVNLPIIGPIKVAGLTRFEATEILKTVYQNYLTNPVVQIGIKNFKITVLGDVRSPGTYQIPNERMTIFEAIGLAGDLNITGNRQNILVVRDRDGIKKEYRLNFTDKNILNSPVYYLEQNDVIYVEPNFTGRTRGTILSTNIVSLLVSAVGISISIYTLTRF
jgi:polysaccharide export outer membrane protein